MVAMKWVDKGLFGFSLFFLLFMGCDKFDRVEVVMSPRGHHIKMFEKFDELAKMRSWAATELDVLVSQNEAIRQDIEQIRHIESFDVLVGLLEQDWSHVNVVISPDKRLIVITWETGLERLGHDLKSIALFKYKDKVIASSLYGEPKLLDRIVLSKDKRGQVVYGLQNNANGLDGTGTVVSQVYDISQGYLQETTLDAALDDNML